MAGTLITEAHDTGAMPVKQHVIGLDTVRAFAALSVMLAHILGPKLPAAMGWLGFSKDVAGLSRYIFTGHPAVIVFFVVSGFCIHYPYTHRALPVVAFALARWTRIMIPAMAAVILAKLSHLPELRWFNFWDGFILWSVVCELWYYSLYPFFLWLSRKVSFEKQFLIAFLISLTLVSYLGPNQYGNAKGYGIGLDWVVALPSWLLGCVLANRVADETTPPQQCGNLAIILWRISVAIVASVLYWLTLNTPVGYYLTMNFFAILVVFWIRAEISLPRDANSSFERAGKWSYSMYLFHMIFFAILSQVIGKSVLSIPLILGLCFLSYKYIEKPSHEYARYLFKKFRNRHQNFRIEGALNKAME